MPYEFHLSDIYNVANGITIPTHTTPNSIRHVLETVTQFEGESRKQNSIEKVIKNNPIFEENLGVYSLIEDLSHGRVRFETIQNQQMLVNACKSVIKFIGQKYPKQIENCEKFIKSTA